VDLLEISRWLGQFPYLHKSCFVDEEKVIDNISVPDNSNGNSAFGNNHCGDAITSQDANQPFPCAKVQ
jgi:hypothetical protein